MGLDLLSTSGPTGLTIDRLVAGTGLSTGSFYHHFAGMPGYRAALLAYFESEQTERYIRQVDGEPGRDARAKLDWLMDLVLADRTDGNVEVAIRAWALQDPEAHAAKERVDRTRMAYLRALWFEISGDTTESHEMAQLLYVLLLGAGSVLPAVTPAELRRLYQRVM